MEINWFLFRLIAVYYIGINAVMFFTMGTDKKRSMDRSKQHCRIPEKNLYLLSFVGGGVGGLISMNYFRHKTKHIDFAIVYTVTAILHIMVIYLLMGTFVFEFTDLATP